jgi:hypothetical protein
MQSNDAIEVVAPLGGGISEVALFPDAAAVLVALLVYWWNRVGFFTPPDGIYHRLRATSPCS